MVTLKATVALAVVISPQGILLIERRHGLPRVAFPRGPRSRPSSRPQSARPTRRQATASAPSVSSVDEYIPPGARIAYVASEFVARLASVSRDREEGNEEVVAYWRPVPEALRLLGPTLFEPVRRIPRGAHGCPPGTP